MSPMSPMSPKITAPQRTSRPSAGSPLKLALPATLTLVLAATLALFVLVLSPAPEAVAGQCICPPTIYQTPEISVDAATCTKARNLLWGESRKSIHCSDGPCYEDLVLTMDCTFNGSGFWVTGYVEYRCWECVQL